MRRRRRHAAEPGDFVEQLELAFVEQFELTLIEQFELSFVEQLERRR